MSLNHGPFPRGLILYPEEGGNTVFRNIGKFLIDYTGPHNGPQYAVFLHTAQMPCALMLPFSIVYGIRLRRPRYWTDDRGNRGSIPGRG